MYRMNKTSSESHFLYKQSGGEHIQFPLLGKETASFSENELLPNACLTDYNKTKIRFRRKSVQSRKQTVANIKGMNKVFFNFVEVEFSFL